MFQCLKCSTRLIPLQFLQAGNVETDQASPQTTLWVMRKHLDTVFVVWGEILLSLPSFGGRLTDRNSWEQQGGRGRERRNRLQADSRGPLYWQAGDTTQVHLRPHYKPWISPWDPIFPVFFAPLALFSKTPFYCAFSGEKHQAEFQSVNLL